MLKQKVIRAETKLIDEAEGLVSAIVSTESPDRDGDIIRQRGWNLDHFNKHPVLLSSHNYRSLQSQIGTWTSMEVKGKKLIGEAKYFIGAGNAEADWGFELAKRGQAAFSVGFIPDMESAKPIDSKNDDFFFFGPYEFNGQELLEVSHVTVPANPDALQRMKAAGLHPVLEGIIDDMLGDEGETFIVEDLLDQVAETVRSEMSSIKAAVERLEGLITGFQNKDSVASLNGAPTTKDEILALLGGR